MNDLYHDIVRHAALHDADVTYRRAVNGTYFIVLRKNAKYWTDCWRIDDFERNDGKCFLVCRCNGYAATVPANAWLIAVIICCTPCNC